MFLSISPRLAALGACLATMLVAMTDARADLEVVVSIKPIHSLVAGVMEGDLAPKLIVDGSASPHSYSLRPSGAQRLQDADLIFWVGHNLESFLEKPIASHGPRAAVVELMDVPGVDLLPIRTGATFETHDHGHDEHEDEHANDEKHEDHDDHEEHASSEEHGHHDDDANPHIWLDPVNAQALVRAIAEALITADPEHAPLYAANAQSMHERIEVLSAELDATLAPARGRPFFVFHDAYQYMERRFGLTAAGSVTLNAEVSPGAGRIREIADKIRTLEATCVFSEPQFSPKLVNVVTAHTATKTGVLDPLGTGIPAGPDLYFTLMRNMAASIRACLSPTG